MTRKALILGCVAALLLGCQRVVAGGPVPTSVVDTLPLSLSQVAEISGFDDLRRVVDTDEPAPDSYLPEGPCDEMADQRVAFGHDWTAFRSVADGGELDASTPLESMVTVVQNIVGYRDDVLAREGFDRRIGDMTACAELDLPGLGGEVSRLDDATAVWVDDGMAIALAIESSILVESSAVALDDNQRIASEVSRRILDRIG